MEQNDSNGKKDWQQQVFLAKNLIRRYNVLHQLHVQQLDGYLVACCNISIPQDSTIELDPDKKIVTYNINTIFEYKLGIDKTTNKKVFVKRSKYDLGRKVAQLPYPAQRKALGRFIIKGSKLHKAELDIAKINLNAWTKEMLWGPQTKVRIIIDGREIT